MSAFSPRQMFVLDEACKPIAEAFDATPYLVGTAATRQEYRDVDVRLILDDETYTRLTAVVGPQLVAFLGLAIGEYLAQRTGMPIDFQVQQQTAANALHCGARNPLGLRTLDNYRGDARVPVGEGESAESGLFAPGECTGASDCDALVHVHGCYRPHRADQCDSPEEYGHIPPVGEGEQGNG